MSKLDFDLKTFISSELGEVANSIDVDHTAHLPKRTEKFIEKFLKDPKGELVKNEMVHTIMHQFRRKCHRHGIRKELILGAFGHGKSLCKGSKVLMFSGEIKNVENIKIGDLLMGDDGSSRRVLALGRGKEKSYKITLKNKDLFCCNESHKMPFYVSNRWNGFHKGDQVVMTIREYLGLPEWVRRNSLKIQKTKLNFKSQYVDFDPYIYGVWLGDGRCNGLTFTINNDDLVIADYLYNWSIEKELIFRLEDEKSYCSTVFINKGIKNASSYFELDFIKNSIINDEKRINKKYLFNSKLIRLQLLAGMIDTDGHLFDNCYEWSTKWEGLRDDFLFLCRSLGFSVSHRTKYINGIPYYIIIVSGNTHLIPCKTRKKASERKQVKNPLVYGFDIEDIGEQDYYGVVLDGNHLYLQDDFTIHHNTEQMCIGVCLEEIAKNPNILIKIVHISEQEASNRVRAIKEYIENDEEYKKLCPHVIPTSIWGQQKFIVKRKTISKDPTCQGFSAVSGALGGRAHLILFDDINDYKSAVLEPSTREAVEGMFKTTWNTRLIQPESESEAIVLMNRWHENDLARYIMNNPIWGWCSIEVAEDKESLIYRDSFGANKNIPLWSKYPKQSLINKHTEMGDRDYNRGYRLIPYSDSDKTFPSFDKCCRYGLKPLSLLGDFRDWKFGAGIDFASDKRPGTILMVGAMNIHTGLKIPVECHALTKPTDLAIKMFDTWSRYGIELFLAENNALQGAIIDLLESHFTQAKFARFGIKIDGFTTGKNKADPNTGLPSLEKEFEKNEWVFCFDKQFTPADNDDRDLQYRLYMEMKHAPFYKTNDLLMSAWFLRECFKKIVRQGSGQYIY